MLLRLSKGTVIVLYLLASLGFVGGFVDANTSGVEVWQESGELHFDNGTTVETVSFDFSQDEQYQNMTLPEKGVLESTAQPVLNLYAFSVVLGADYGNATKRLPNALLAVFMFVVPLGPPTYFVGHKVWRSKRK